MPVNQHPVQQEDVMAYLDGELTPEKAAEITGHLTQCRACQDVAADLQAVSRQLSGWSVETATEESVPGNLTAALTERFAQKPKLKPRIWQRYFALHHRQWIAAALVVIIAPVALLLFRGSPPPRSQKADIGVYYRDQRQRAQVATDFAPNPAPNAFAPPSPALPPAEPMKRQQSPLPLREVNKATPLEPAAPMVARTAQLQIKAKNFDTVRADLDRILAQFGGHIGSLQMNTPSGDARSLDATLRVPGQQLDAALNELRKLGHLESESQQGEEVTQQWVDLEARLANARREEQTLLQILGTRAGKLSDVLEVEQELARVRGEIEQAEAERKNLSNRVNFATVTLRVNEEYRSPIAPAAAHDSVGTQLHNSAADGVHMAFNGIIGFLQFLLSAGPSILLVGLVIGLPGYFFWKKLRH